MILLVEDEPTLREGLTDILTFGGYEVTAAHAPSEALQILSTCSVLPELIISDIMMPGMDGYQFLAEVRSNYSKDTPFLYISGLEATILTNDPAYGKIGYLNKPFTVAELLSMIARILS
jgi:CheY-like chemotaxis protein